MSRAFTLPAPVNPISIGRLIDHHSGRDPDFPAISCGEVTLSRSEFAARINRRGRALQRAGVRGGDFVAIALPNSIAFMELAFACWALGATPAPVSHRLPRLEAEAILHLLGPRLIVSEGLQFQTRFAEFRPEDLYDLELSPAPLPERVSRYVKAIPSGGSTGRPKVIVDRAPGLLDPDVPSLGMRYGDTVLVPGPLYHSAPFGFGYLALAAGCHLVIMPRFDAAGTLELIERHRVAWLYVVPTMMHRIWALGEGARARADLSSLELVCHIASACPVWLKEKWIDWLGPDRIWEGYSGTESIAATLIGGREWLAHKGSVGRVSAGTQIHILDEEGNPVVPGEVGEIFFRSAPGRGSPYHYLGAEPRRRGDLESYGDLGHLDEEGYLYLADRRTDLIISGGANIYPAEIEAAIDAWPGVLSSVAIGLPHDDLGHSVHAIIEMSGLEPDHDPAALKAFLGERLAPFKMPRSFEFTTERLRDDAGKVRRSALRQARIVPCSG